MATSRFARCYFDFKWAGALLLCAIVLVGPSAHLASAQQSNIQEAKVEFVELNDSGLAGVASLIANGKSTAVSMRVDGALGDHPTHIHQGTCDDLDPNPEFPLTNVQLQPASMTGASETKVTVPLKELLDEPHLILIHKSAKDIGTYLACGNIVAGALTASQKAANNITSPLPGTGAGEFAAASDQHRITWMLLAAAVLFAMSGMRLLGRREGAGIRS